MTVILIIRSTITATESASLHLPAELTEAASDAPALVARASNRELHPVANAIVDREVAKAAERRAILG